MSYTGLVAQESVFHMQTICLTDEFIRMNLSPATTSHRCRTSRSFSTQHYRAASSVATSEVRCASSGPLFFEHTVRNGAASWQSHAHSPPARCGAFAPQKPRLRTAHCRRCAMYAASRSSWAVSSPKHEVRAVHTCRDARLSFRTACRRQRKQVRLQMLPLARPRIPVPCAGDAAARQRVDAAGGGAQLGDVHEHDAAQPLRAGAQAR